MLQFPVCWLHDEGAGWGGGAGTTVVLRVTLGGSFTSGSVVTADDGTFEELVVTTDDELAASEDVFESLEQPAVTPTNAARIAAYTRYFLMIIPFLGVRMGYSYYTYIFNKNKKLLLANSTNGQHHKCMRKIVLFEKDNVTLELSALFLFIFVLVANLTVIKYAEGYFEYFDVPLGQVSFAPQIYDYMRIAMPVLVISITVTLLTIFTVKASVSLGELVANRTRPSKGFLRYAKRHKRLFKNLLEIMNFASSVFIVGAVVWTSYNSTVELAKNLGKVNAANMIKLSSISKSGDSMQEIIIYKGSGEIITKKYDTSKKEFLGGYQVITANDYRVRYITK